MSIRKKKDGKLLRELACEAHERELATACASISGRDIHILGR
jgi:hypothetical protein